MYFSIDYYNNNCAGSDPINSRMDNPLKEALTKIVCLLLAPENSETDEGFSRYVKFLKIKKDESGIIFTEEPNVYCQDKNQYKKSSYCSFL